MQEGQNARQQVVERIRQSTSILVAVGNNPSVDALAAALGLSLMLNKLNKHTTTVFSGQTPPAIQFLEPNKTFENNVDALRDFIISLNKEKADRLRYKVEDDVVRIFITPYKTSITEKDLQYSQGDFNVDLIVALGVEKRDDLDKAIVSHGRILHDATVVTVNAGNQRSSLGAIDWNEPAASSLCEMLVGASEAFQQPGILDEQISTALLTGIVAATDRFSNKQTTPRVMTMAAQLMAAGANQQLIAVNLDQARASAGVAKPDAGPMAKQQAAAAPTPMPEDQPKKKEPGELDITHVKEEPKPPVPMPAPIALTPAPKVEPAATSESVVAAEKELEAALPESQVSHNMLPDLQKDLQAAVEKQKAETGEEPSAPGSQSVNNGMATEAPEQEDYISSHGSWKGKRLEPPTLGGVLNATTEEAMEEAKKAQDEDRNKTLLTHPNEQPEQSRGKRGKRGGGGGERGDRKPDAVPQAPVLPPAPLPEPVTPEVAPALLPTPEPPVVEPLPPIEPSIAPLAPAEPLSTPAPIEPQAPVLPPAPALPPAPTAAPLPPEPAAPAMPPEVDLDSLHKEVAASAAEAAAAAQPAESVAGDINSARQAVSAALDAQPFSPAGQPAASVGAQPVPAMPNVPVAEPLSQNALDALPPAPPIPEPTPADLPPLPPMPPLPSSETSLPPAPDLPGLNEPLPPVAAPDLPPAGPPPAPAPSDPAQFKIPGA